MKVDSRLLWGIVLLFIGTVLLLENFGVIHFYWRSVWRFWPVFLVIAGINILFSKNNPKLGSIISLVLLILTLVLLFFRGQQSSRSLEFWSDRNDSNFEEYREDDEGTSAGSSKKLTLSEPFNQADSLKKAVLNISGGGISFNLKEATDQLIEADLKNNKAGYTLRKEVTDSASVITFKSADKKTKWNFGDDNNSVDFRLNKTPNWELNMKLGAGEADFDFEDYKIRTFHFEGGAASLNIKVGALLPITDVVVKSGVADVKINVPANSGCRIKTKTGLSAKDFSGFTKISEGVYETDNYKNSASKIFINLDGGLSNFEVNRY